MRAGPGQRAKRSTGSGIRYQPRPCANLRHSGAPHKICGRRHELHRQGTSAPTERDGAACVTRQVPSSPASSWQPPCSPEFLSPKLERNQKESCFVFRRHGCKATSPDRTRFRNCLCLSLQAVKEGMPMANMSASAMQFQERLPCGQITDNPKT